MKALILGWHGSAERQLRPIARWYETRGFTTRIVITPTFGTMGLPGAWSAFGEKLAAEMEEGTTIHAFSNTGFWTMSALLDATRATPRRVVIDSAPGFPSDRIPPWFTARYATAAMMPSLLSSLGRAPRTFHPLLTPPIAIFFGVWHVLARKQVAFMASGQERVIDRLRGVPTLAIWSDADTLVPAEHVRAFLDRAYLRGVTVERLHFTDSAHVRHFVQHRAEYFARLEAFVR